MTDFNKCLVIEDQNVYVDWPVFRRIVKDYLECNPDVGTPQFDIDEYSFSASANGNSQEEREVNKNYRHPQMAFTYLLCMPPAAQKDLEEFKSDLLLILNLQVNLLEDLTKTSNELTAVLNATATLLEYERSSISLDEALRRLEKKENKLRLKLEHIESIDLKTAFQEANENYNNQY